MKGIRRADRVSFRAGGLSVSHFLLPMAGVGSGRIGNRECSDEALVRAAGLALIQNRV